MVVFRYEWKRNRKYILIWAVALAVCIFCMTPVYYGMIDTPETLSENFTQGGFFETVGVSLALLMEPLGMYSFLNAFFMIAAWHCKQKNVRSIPQNICLRNHADENGFIGAKQDACSLESASWGSPICLPHF